MRSFFPTSSSFLPSFLPSIPPTFRFRSVSSFFTSSPVHPFHLRSPSQSILIERMPSFHPEQGKTLLAEVLFLRHSVDIRCPSCPGNPGCPGHTRDQGGKATKAGGLGECGSVASTRARNDCRVRSVLTSATPGTSTWPRSVSIRTSSTVLSKRYMPN